MGKPKGGEGAFASSPPFGGDVEVAGIEPASFNTKTGLLRVQPVALFSAPAISQASRRRAQSLFGFPYGPVTGPDG